MSYGIWLSYNNQQEGFQIPINPSSIEISDGGKGTTYDVAGLGEINVIKDIKLTEYSFKSIFPAQEYPFIATNLLLKPEGYIDYITKWMKTKKPIRFIFTGDSFDINEAVSIEDFNWKEEAGGGGDIEYSIKLKKYIFHSPKKVVVVPSTSDNNDVTVKKEPPVRKDDREAPKTYTMIAGDTLWSVAKKILGDGGRWKELQRLNNITDSEVKRLSIGKVLKLPEVN
ncbi:LysM peptidoglycan-binding domain-containing protein [Alkaliphilus peptidifermentans]|uniref:LysM domain-containing protein n=1 Tax=Alkaliphilus peptidifermentans DSM 18978 TaxID=1120976 RepID=A0A1G5JZC9_9FIRM|nr:LysM peptidoglycan-binding domain-containing protein [Alkaliphilus peptidifermentans]SCY93220.1 LysM domain-containing protein [Alkaliphilus peptidifermentans DSM 18978]